MARKSHERFGSWDFRAMRKAVRDPAFGHGPSFRGSGVVMWQGGMFPSSIRELLCRYFATSLKSIIFVSILPTIFDNERTNAFSLFLGRVFPPARMQNSLSAAEITSRSAL
jgi:hypothetical protein